MLNSFQEQLVSLRQAFTCHTVLCMLLLGVCGHISSAACYKLSG